MDLLFTRKLIRGRIAEVVFEQMIRGEKRYTVIPFGYEHTMPTLAQYRGLAQIKEVVENISDAPDFALISEDKRRVYLVEVKYQSHFDLKRIIAYADKLLKRWNPSWLFIATPDGFYADPCNTIVRNKKIRRLPQGWAPLGHQREYQRLLNEFEKG